MNASPRIIIRQGLYEDMDKSQVWMSRNLFAEVFKSGESKVNRPRVKLRFGRGRSCFAEALALDKVVEGKVKTRGGKNNDVKLTDSDLLLSKWQRSHLGIWEVNGNPGGKDWEKIDGWYGLKSEELEISACVGWFSQLMASHWIMKNHPQAIVRGAYWLGVIGIILGIGGLVDVTTWVKLLLPCI